MISPCFRGRLGPSVLTRPAVPIQDTAMLHTLPPWEPLAPLETQAPLQGQWTNLHGLAALQSCWPLMMQDHSQGGGRHHQHLCLTQKMRVLHLPHCETVCLQPPSPTPMAAFTAAGFDGPKQPPPSVLLYSKQLPPYAPSINMWGVITTSAMASTPG